MDKRYWLFPAGVGIAAGIFAAFRGGSTPAKTNPPLPKQPPVPPMNATKLTAYLADAFFRGIVAMGNHFRERGATIEDEALLEVFLSESDVGPHIANSIGCLGLNQICPTIKGQPLSGLRAVGFQGSREEYLALAGEDQLPFVQRFFDNTNGGKSYPLIRDVGSLYLCNFSPAFLGKPDNFVMYRRVFDADGKPQPSTYEGNRTVDTGGKGWIEVGDMAKFCHRSSAGRIAKWTELRGRLAAVKAVA